MTHHICQAAKDSSTLRRVVFASSNHVMGRYKDKNLLAGELNTELKLVLAPFGILVTLRLTQLFMLPPNFLVNGFAK